MRGELECGQGHTPNAAGPNGEVVRQVTLAGELVYESDIRVLSIGQQSWELTPGMDKIFRALLDRAGGVCTRDELARWRDPQAHERGVNLDSTLKSDLHRLRVLLGPALYESLICLHRGVGYSLRVSGDESDAGVGTQLTYSLPGGSVLHDPNKCTLRVGGGETVQLTPLRSRLLGFFAVRRGTPASYDEVAAVYDPQAHEAGVDMRCALKYQLFRLNRTIGWVAIRQRLDDYVMPMLGNDESGSADIDPDSTIYVPTSVGDMYYNWQLLTVRVGEGESARLSRAMAKIFEVLLSRPGRAFGSLDFRREHASSSNECIKWTSRLVRRLGEHGLGALISRPGRVFMR